MYMSPADYRIPIYKVLKLVWVLPSYQTSVQSLSQAAVEYDGWRREMPILLRFINMTINDATVQLDEGLEVCVYGGLKVWRSGGMCVWESEGLEVWRYVCMGVWRYSMCVWSSGGMWVWESGGMCAWRSGGMCVWRLGVMYVCMKDMHV